jgi:hypothetical protein
MCKKSKGIHNRIDPCLKPLIKWLNSEGYNLRASCCGHSVYPITIVVEGKKNGKKIFVDLLTETIIPRTRKFYKKDKNGIYYIPEVCDENT